MNVNAELISIGNELLIGDTVNTNASWLGEFLTQQGVEVTAVHTVGDDLEQVRRTLRESLDRSDLVVTTGGLGPTHDDVTKKALQELFDAGLVVDDSVLKFIKKIFEKRNIPFSRSNYHQAEVLENCEVLFNKQGTAPGMWFRDPETGTALAVLPGVPHEMKHLMQEKVLPKLAELLPDKEFRRSRYLVTAGIGESTLSDEVIGDLDPFLQNGTTVAYLPSPQGTRIRISASGRTDRELEEKMNRVADHIYDKAGDLIIGEGKELSLSEVVGNHLRERGLTLACAESCTGGLLASTLTDIPGSSDYMIGGIIAYSNRIKIDDLAVSKKVLKQEGAVSRETALQMAR
ncbi:MAG: CinA family nicotinamide mononucleotide deamidase-related protein, partial [Balneolaceae bacterium]|nr:CinA family nicotinamide mononucleotide deamidase-related protein [Balneolaceae bacterium]